MTLPPRVVVLLVLLSLVAAACTGSADPDATASPTDEVGAETTSTEQGAVTPAGGQGIEMAPGAQVADIDPVIIESAEGWLDEKSGLTDMLREEIFLSRVTQTLDVYHLLFVQQHDAVSVRGAVFIVHVRDTGEVLGASTSLIETLPGEGTTEELTQAEALEIAEKSVPGTVSGDPVIEATWLEVGQELRLGWDVMVATEGPPSSYSVIVDATTGNVLSVDRLATDHSHRARDLVAARGDHAQEVAQVEVAQAAACDLPPAPSACIFVVDPIYASGNTGIAPTQANATLVGVPLANLTDPTGADLTGLYAQIAPQIAAQYRSPDGIHGRLGRGGQDISFEAAMTYYWIDYSQQIVQEMGFDFHADDPVDFVPIEPEFPDNAFYIFLEDRIHMGIGSDGVNEAEDAQGVIHEYGHALLQAAVPNILSEEGGAVHEGFADLVSVFTTLEFRNGDVGCLFHWAERGTCIRRIDTDLRYPDDLRFAVHQDGEIYTGAIYEVFRRVLERDTGLTPEQCQDRQTNPCDGVRDEVYATLLGSLPFLTPALSLNDATAAFAAADQVFFVGRNADIITEVFGERGLAASGTTSVQIEGLMDFERSDATLSVKITHTYRGDLSARLDVVDAAGEPLCASTLFSADPDDDADNVQGRFQLAGTDCEPFLPPGPDQIWLLTVTDSFVEDEGTLFQYAISYQGQRFLAPGLPAAIPDADAIGVTAAIGGPVPASMPASDTAPSQPAPMAEGSVTAEYAVTHTYVGDLQVQVVVANLDASEVLCRVDLRQPDPQDSSADLDERADVSDCGAFYPPSPTQAWVLRVADLAPADVGEVTAFRIVGPDGTVHEGRTPQAIPDDDQSGVAVAITG